MNKTFKWEQERTLVLLQSNRALEVPEQINRYILSFILLCSFSIEIIMIMGIGFLWFFKQRKEKNEPANSDVLE